MLHLVAVQEPDTRSDWFSGTFLVLLLFNLLPGERGRRSFKLQAFCGYSRFFFFCKCAVNYRLLTSPDSVIDKTEM